MLLTVALLALGFSSGAAAQNSEHGAGITKGCVQNISTCDVDADCDDADFCTEEVCNTGLPDTMNCTFTVRNLDEFNDSLSVIDVFDTISNVGGPTVIPAGSLTIDLIQGNATCAAGGTALPCVLGPAGGGQNAGSVRFRSNVYQPTMADFAAQPLLDQANGRYFDLCDGPGTVGCDPTTLNLVQSPAASTALIDGCEYTPVPCDDGNLCTDDSCDPNTGCVFEPNIVCDDQNLCTDDSCDPNTGECVFEPNIVCDDQNLCTDDSCDPNTGQCVFDPNIVCDDQNLCTDDSCDPNTGECVFDPNTVCDDQNL
jgi:hypothetical protein